MSYLYLFQIGPVQAFIAQARRTQDLYVGSRILSELASAGVRAAQNLNGFQPIFPMPDERGNLPKSVPHRFAFLSDADPSEVAAVVNEAVETEWLERFAGSVFTWLKSKIGGSGWEDAFNRQVHNWLEFNWVAVAYDRNQHSQAYQEASRALAARRASRSIPAVDEPGWKCTLTGAQSALDLDWERLRQAIDDSNARVLRRNEKLGALALIKRFAGKQYANCKLDDDGFPSTDEIAGASPDDEGRGKDVQRYLAVLHMDGDQMGKRLSEMKSLREHQDFSRALTRFADDIVPNMLRGFARATLVYSGGDDVLALMPLENAIEVADRLRDAFHDATGCTASAGVALTPANMPLDMALDLARTAEETAKDDLGRNAIVITEAHGTGQKREAGARWEITGVKIADAVREVQGYFAADKLSGKLAYDLQTLAYEMVPAGAAGSGMPDRMWADARRAELRRLITRRISEGVREDERRQIVSSLVGTLTSLGEDPGCGWAMLANWLILARFMAQGQSVAREKRK